MPSIKFPSLPSWMGGGGADGSHATGLAQVPFDGYKAILHKDEAVLTARQSNALRDAGILGTTGSRPTLNLEKMARLVKMVAVVEARQVQHSHRKLRFILMVVQTMLKRLQKAEEAAQRALEKFWNQMNLAT